MLTNVSLDKKLLEEVIALDGTKNLEHPLVDVVDAIVERALREYVQRKKEFDSHHATVQLEQVDDCNDLVAAAVSSLGFWDNEIDDAEWNNA